MGGPQLIGSGWKPMRRQRLGCANCTNYTDRRRRTHAVPDAPKLFQVCQACAFAAPIGNEGNGNVSARLLARPAATT